jgi:hypothetical protein
MDKLSIILLFAISCIFLSCSTEEPPVATYQIQVDNALVNDTIDHKVSYTFEVRNSLTSALETGMWEVQLLKQDSSYFTVLKEENSKEFKIQSGSLIEKIPTDQLFQYDGLRIKGRILFNGNDGQVTVEKAFTVSGKPAKPIFYILSTKENGYPDELNATFGFHCNGATRIVIEHKNYDYGYIDDYVMDKGACSEYFNDLDTKTINIFSVYASNFLGTTISEPIYIGEKE